MTSDQAMKSPPAQPLPAPTTTCESRTNTVHESLYQHHEQEIREVKSKIIRPLRPTRIGHVQTRDAGDDCFIRSAIDREIFSQYVANPKCEDTASCD